MAETDGGMTFTLIPSVPGSQIRYTTDGTYPTVHSPLYDGKPVTAPSKEDFHAITVVDGKKMSLPIYFAPDYSAYKEYGKLAAEWNPLQIQPKESPWQIDATGKISGNGKYDITFIPTKGKATIYLGKLALYKRNEKIAEVEANNVLTDKPVQYSFSVDSFEAGTPFTVVVSQWGKNADDSHGLVFIRKID